MYTNNIHNFSLNSYVYALALLSFVWNMRIVLAIFFTFKVAAKVSRVLKNQLYTDICILNDMFSVKVFTFHDWCGICINWSFFKSSNRMIHPYIFLILRQSKMSEVINENRTECKYGQKCNQIMRFCFFDELFSINKRNAHILLIMHHN